MIFFLIPRLRVYAECFVSRFWSKNNEFSIIWIFVESNRHFFFIFGLNTVKKIKCYKKPTDSEKFQALTRLKIFLVEGFLNFLIA